ncbi:hypothetical protein BC828DRAFT_84036 [Blastocladiella britannica]|nr:hypothetical protein BC828DRAFT_84036 [Blastocladiella britannica]
MERQKLQDALAASRVTSFAQVSALQSQTQALESDLAAADDRIHELEDLVDELHSDLEALRASRRDRSPRSISSRASTPAASPPMDAATNCGPEGQGMRRSASMQGEMEHLMRQLRSVDTTRARLEDQCAVLSGQSRAAAERAAAATADRDAAQRRVSELLDVCKDLEQQITDGAKQFDAARRECEAAHRLAMERQARMEDLERQCADAAVRVTTARDLVAAMADKRGSDAAAKDDGEDVAAEMERLQDEVRLLNTELDQTSNLLDEAKRTAERALQRATRAEQDKADMTRELVEMQTKVQAADEAAELVARARDTEAALGQVRTARDALAVRLEESESKVTRLNSEYVGAMGRVADLAAENGQLAESLAAAQHDLAETRAELEPLKVEHEQLAAEYSEVAEQAAAAMAARDDAVQAAKTSDAAAKDAERQRLLTQSTLVETQNQLTLANRQIDRSRTASVGSPGPHGRRPGTPSTPGRSTASGGDRATAAQLQVDLTARDRQLDELRTQYADVVQQFHAISAKSAAMKRAVSAKLAALDARERDTQSVQLEFVQLEKNYLGQIEELHATISDLREALQEAHAAIDAKEGAIAELEHMLDAQQTQVIPAHIARRVSGRYFAADDHQQEDDGDDEDPATEPTSAMGQVRLAMQSQETEHLRDEIHERELRLVSAHGQIEKLATELLCVCAERDDLVAKLRAAQAAAATEAANKELQQAQLRNHATATSLGPTALDSIMTMDDDDQVAPQFFTTAPAAAATSGSSAAAAAEAASSLQHVAHALVELKREYTVRVAERDELQRKLAQERKYFAKRSADADSERAQLLDHLVALEDKAATVAANAAASQSGVAAEERARAQRYKGKEETSWRLIQDLGISRPTRGSTPLHPRTRLRMGILAVVAAIRLTRLAFKARAQLQQLQRSEGSATPTPKGTSLPLQSSSSAPSTSRALAARQRTDSNVSSGGGAVPASTEQLGSRRRMSGSK